MTHFGVIVLWYPAKVILFSEERNTLRIVTFCEKGHRRSKECSRGKTWADEEAMIFEKRAARETRDRLSGIADDSADAWWRIVGCDCAQHIFSARSNSMLASVANERTLSGGGTIRSWIRSTFLCVRSGEHVGAFAALEHFSGIKKSSFGVGREKSLSSRLEDGLSKTEARTHGCGEYKSLRNALDPLREKCAGTGGTLRVKRVTLRIRICIYVRRYAFELEA